MISDVDGTQKVIYIRDYENLIENEGLFDILKVELKKIHLTKYYFEQIRKNRFLSKSEIVRRELFNLFKIFRSYRKLSRSIWLLNGLHYSFLFANKIFPFFRIKKIIIHNFYLHELGGNKIIRMIIKFLMSTKNIHIVVQSKSEIEFYRKLAPSALIEFFPFCMKEILLQDNLVLNKKELYNDFIFTGGYTNRDFNLVFECARLFPNKRFIVIASKLLQLDTLNLPSNIFLLYDTSSNEFNYILSKSKIVIIPLKSNVGSSGQMLALAAMQFKKPTIYCDLDIVGQYFIDGKTGLSYELGNINSLIKKLDILLANTDMALELGTSAHNYYLENFSLSAKANKFKSLVYQYV